MSDGDVILIPRSDPRLGRNINHDPRNRMFAVARGGVPDKDVRHRYYGKRLNQGQVGACTGFTGATVLNTAPLRGQVKAKLNRRTFDANDAFNFYHLGTTFDDWGGEYPPEDTGSSGLGVCKGLASLGLITSYEWAFGHQHGLENIGISAFMQGTYWTDAMFYPDADGRVHPVGADAGGHEYTWVGIEYRSKRTASQNRSWFLNSWGVWGPKGGYFYMTWEDHASLLERDGDLIRPVV